MPDLAEALTFLLGLSCVVVAVTVVGHGIWVSLAWLIQYSSRDRLPSETGHDCPLCGGRKAIFAGRCQRCGETARISVTSPLSRDVSATQRQLRRLAEIGALSEQLREQLSRALLDASVRIDVSQSAGHGPATAEPAPAEPLGDPAVRAESATRPLAPEEVFEADIVESAGGEPTHETPPLPPVRRPGSAAPGDGERSAPAAVHPLDRPETAAPPAPRRPAMAFLLRSFMEEKNIRWGEIISGLLIVVCAVGLVISLWATLRDSIPYLPALIFLTGTAALHAAGHYTLKKWELHSISRAVLIIATLLIPLNFLAAITLSPRGESAAALPLFLVATIVGLAGYGVMTWYSGRALLREGGGWLFLAVLGPSAGQILVHRLARSDATLLESSVLLAAPVAAYLIAVGGGLVRARGWRRLSPPRAQPLLVILGIGTFAVACPLALLLAKSPTIASGLSRLSPELSLIGGAILSAGLLLDRRVKSRRLAALRATGTALAVAGAFVLLAAIGFAWPTPVLLLVVGLANAVLLLAAAAAARLPVLHAAAVASGGLAFFVTFHVLTGTYPSWRTSSAEIVRGGILTGYSAVAFALYGLIVLIAGGVLWNRRRADAAVIMLSGGGVCVVSTFIAAIAGCIDVAGAEVAPLVLCVHGIAACGGGLYVSDPRPASFGAGVLYVAFAQAAIFNQTVRDAVGDWAAISEQPLLIATVTFCLLTATAVCVVGRRSAWSGSEGRRRAAWKGFVDPLSVASLIGVAISLPLIIFTLEPDFSRLGLCTAVLAGCVLGIAVVRIRAAGMLAFQCLATLAVSLLTAAFWQRHEDWDWFGAGHLHGQLLALASWSLAWRAATFAGRGSRFVRELVPSSWYSIDTILVPVLLGLLLTVSGLGVLPGITVELGIEEPAVLDTASRTWPLWLTLTVLVATTGLLARQRVTALPLAAWMLELAVVPILAAAPAFGSAATASALRWNFAVYAGVVVGLLAARTWLANKFSGILGRVEVRPREIIQLTVLPLMVGVGSVLFLTTWTLVRVAVGGELGGPAIGSLFHRIGPNLSHAVPMIFCVASLLVAATRERQPWLALAGSLVLQYLTSLAYLLPLLSSGGDLDSSSLAGMLQWNAITLGLYGLAWLLLRKRIDALDGHATARPDSSWQVVATVAAVATLSAWAAAAIVFHPDRVESELRVLGGWPTHAGLLLAVVAAGLRFRREPPWLPRLLTPLAVALVPLIVAGYSTRGGVPGRDCLYLLTCGWSVVALAQAAFAGVWPRLASADRWYGGLAAVTTPLALESAAMGAAGPWWALASMAMLSIAGACFAVLRRRQAQAYLTVVLVALAAMFLWRGLTPVPLPADYLRLAQWVVLAVVTICFGWLLLELRSQRRGEGSFAGRESGLPCHRLLTLPSLVLTCGLSFFCYWIATISRSGNRAAPFEISSPSGWVVAGALAAVLIAMLWDRRAQQALLGLYAWGLLGLLLVLDACSFKMMPAVTAFALGLAAQVAITGWNWKRGVHWSEWGLRHGIPEPVAGLRSTATWLPAFSGVLTACAVLVGLIAVFSFPARQLRFLAAAIPFVTAIGIAGLAQDRQRRGFRLVSLLLITLGGIYLGWADIDPALDGGTWLDRLVRVLMVLGAAAFVFSVVLARRIDPASAWTTPLRQGSVVNAAGAAGALAAILLVEWVFYLDDPRGGAPINGAQLAAVAVVLVGLIAALLTLALLPESKSWVESERARMRLVHGAQAIGGLLFAHLYLARPAWFHGELRYYWPYILMAIAFAGAGVGEIFRRAGIRVLGEPLQQTGTFLPLLPALGIWLVASKSDHSVVLFTAGMLYVFLSLTRRSTSHLAAAVIAGNAAFWSLLHQHDFSLWRAPQFWLIPPAVSVLAAGELNRKRLQPELLTSLRYGGLIVIYISSVGEMFLRGIGDQLWPPIVLLTLSLMGAMLGMALRIRPFLFLGSTFAFLSVLSMVWHASRAIEHSWPWWAFGIGLGLSILVFFGFFEKNRERVNRMVDGIREW